MTIFKIGLIQIWRLEFFTAIQSSSFTTRDHGDRTGFRIVVRDKKELSYRASAGVPFMIRYPKQPKKESPLLDRNSLSHSSQLGAQPRDQTRLFRYRSRRAVIEEFLALNRNLLKPAKPTGGDELFVDRNK